MNEADDILEELGINKKICKECGGSFLASTNKKQFCSKKCSKKTYRYNNRDTINEKQRNKAKTNEYKEKRKIYHDKNPHIHKNQNLKKIYGINLNEYNLILKNQNYRCAICFKEEIANNKFHVDHDHTTKIVRAILCNKCNVGIGYFEENVEIMHNAINYITKHKGR